MAIFNGTIDIKRVARTGPDLRVEVQLLPIGMGVGTDRHIPFYQSKL